MLGYGAHAATDVLTKAAGTAGVVSSEIQGHKAALRPMVDGLAGRWEGTARPAFEAAHLNWEQGVDRLIAALSELGEGVGFSANTYLEADSQGKAAFNGAMREV